MLLKSLQKQMPVAIFMCLSLLYMTPPAKADLVELLKAHQAYSKAKDSGDQAEATTYARKALALGEKEYGPTDVRNAELAENLADLYLETGDHQNAETLFARALKLRESADGLTHPNLVSLLEKLIQTKLGLGKSAEANEVAQRILYIQNRIFGKKHPKFALTLASIEAIYLRSNHPWDEKSLMDSLPVSKLKLRGKKGSPFTTLRVFYGTNRKRTGNFKHADFYGSENGDLDFGYVDVSIPKSHEVGMLEAPAVLSAENPSDHILILTLETRNRDEFISDLSSHIQQSASKEAFVFVHGYNVTFNDSARRTAQLAYDLKFNGAPILYSWPSGGSYISYLTDEDRISSSVDELTDFLELVSKQSNAERVHLIAHSMGNRAAVRAMEQLANKDTKYFDQVILTAPDVDARDFTDMTRGGKRTAHRVTLYCSESDLALSLSNVIHGDSQRAGQCSNQTENQTENDTLVLPGIDTVNMSRVEADSLGHSYYGDHEAVLNDLSRIIGWNASPNDRCGMTSLYKTGQEYWAFYPKDCGGEEIRIASLLVKRHGTDAVSEAMLQFNQKKVEQDIHMWRKILQITKQLISHHRVKATGER